MHEHVNDNSEIGFKRLQVLREYKQSSINIDKLENLPVLSKEIPQTTTKILKIEGASKRKQHLTTRTRRRRYDSL